MTPALIIPGLNGSPNGHWQTWLQASLPLAHRVEQDDWDAPDLEAWLLRFALTVAAIPGAVIVAHSLGCILAAHAATRCPELPISGALLVAPADVDSPEHTPDLLRGFAPTPTALLPFPSIVVASVNDPFMTLSSARNLAHAWGSRFINAGAVGHINIASGHGPWSAARELFQELATGKEYGTPSEHLRRSG